MADIKRIQVDGVDHIVHDEVARSQIGDLSGLETTEKSDLVAAINEAAKSGGSDGVTSWNDLNDKPFGDSPCYEWIAGEEYAEKVSAEKVSSGEYTFAKISNDAPELSSVIGGMFFMAAVAEGEEHTQSFEVNENTAEQSDGSWNVSDFFFVVTADSFVLDRDALVTQVTLSRGIWVIEVPGMTHIKMTVEGIKTIDEKYIPDTIARTSDVIPAPATASVGQTVVVKAVDENGKPTEWEAADFPTGGGTGSGPVQYVESLDESNLKNLRDLESGTYVLNGYFYPYAGADDTLTCDNTMVSVAHLSAGSHVLVFNPLNCKVNFIEILVDETAEGGFTYSVQLIDMRDLPALIEAVGSRDDLATEDKTSIVAAINELVASAGNGGGGGGGASVQPDWNQNDETAADYVKNRPFYTGDLVTENFGSVTLMFSGSNPVTGSLCNLQEGGVYIVTFDGVPYECVAEKNPDGMVFVGNGGIIGVYVNEDMPFLFVYYPEVDINFFFAAEQGEHTFTIEGRVQDIKKIDPKYLPDGVGYSEYVQGQVVPETTLEGFTETMQGLLYGARHEASVSIVPNGNYRVVWDGVSYDLPGQLESHGAAYIGNGNYPEGTTEGDIPFAIIDTGNGVWFVLTEPADSSHTFSVDGPVEKVHIIDSKYLPDDLFPSTIKAGGLPGAETFNDTSNIASGENSHAEGTGTKAQAHSAHAEGIETTASGYASHAEGSRSTASGVCSHAEGGDTTASGKHSHAEGSRSTASGESSHAEGRNSVASGDYSHAEGFCCDANGEASHAEGWYTVATSAYQHVQGKYNIEDAENKYAHIVGNGENDALPSNAHTVDWDGNAWYAGTVETTGIILKSSTAGSSKRFLVTVDDSGNLTASEITA